MTKKCPQCGSTVNVQRDEGNLDMYEYYFSCCKEHFWESQRPLGWWKEVDGKLVPVVLH
jgi:hypothetical protein